MDPRDSVKNKCPVLPEIYFAVDFKRTITRGQKLSPGSTQIWIRKSDQYYFILDYNSNT